MVVFHDIRIHKVKSWMIKFSIDGQKYFIKQNDDDEPTIMLYRFDHNENGGYKTELLASVYGHLYINNYLGFHKGMAYRDVDCESFIDKLCFQSLNPDLSNEEFQYRTNRQLKVNIANEICNLQEQQKMISDKIRKLKYRYKNICFKMCKAERSMISGDEI